MMALGITHHVINGAAGLEGIGSSLAMFLSALVDAIWQFFGLGELFTLIQSGDTAKLLSLEGLWAIFMPLIPLLLLAEIISALARGQFSWRHFKVPLSILLVNGVIGRFVSLSIAVAIASQVQNYALLQTEFTWYWFIYGYVVWEFSHFVYHWLGHKVRLLWCIHSTHHAPEHMNLSVSYAHFFLEAPYADLVRIGICTLMGVDPLVLMIVVGVDAIWGSLIHIGEELVPDGRLGFLQRIILTPSHHRLHHARNPLYIDTNFCNLLNIWDRLFGTYREQQADIPPDYGIKRPMNSNSFLDVYFGEFAALLRDIRRAPKWQDKLCYLLMPPDWRHDDVAIAETNTA